MKSKASAPENLSIGADFRAMPQEVRPVLSRHVTPNPA